jgi:hypothetical protein
MAPDQVSGGRFCPFSGQYNSVSANRTSFAPWAFFSILKEDELDAGDHDQNKDPAFKLVLLDAAVEPLSDESPQDHEGQKVNLRHP